MKVAFTQTDPAVSRSVFYEQLCAALARQPQFVESEADADILIPAEDTALENNWPRYGNLASALIRGTFDPGVYEGYLRKLAASPKPVCVLNLHPGYRLPQIFRGQLNIAVADGNLSTFERAINPRTICLPALPIQAATEKSTRPRDVLASYRGVASHPVRQGLMQIHNGTSILCQTVSPANHHGKLDATAGAKDDAYVSLLQRSVFAFVPRGDSLFSYRLLEVMSFGCIPIVLSDGWILPFDRTIDWSNVGMTIPESAVGLLPQILQMFTPDRIAAMASNVSMIYDRHFATMDAYAATLLGEIARFISPRQPA